METQAIRRQETGNSKTRAPVPVICDSGGIPLGVARSGVPQAGQAVEASRHGLTARDRATLRPQTLCTSVLAQDAVTGIMQAYNSGGACKWEDEQGKQDHFFSSSCCGGLR